MGSADPKYPPVFVLLNEFHVPWDVAESEDEARQRCSRAHGDYYAKYVRESLNGGDPE